MIIRYGGRRIAAQAIRHPRGITESTALSAVRHASSATTTQSVGPTDPATSVAALLAQVDRASTLAARFYPTALQRHFLAIRAFNAEVARVSDSVDNELMARIRVAWWRDAVTSAFNGKPPRHPTMLALADAIHDPLVLQHGGLVLDHFVAICDAREGELSAPAGPPTLEDVERYAEKTSSRLFYLSLNMLGVATPAADELFSHLGKARGIAQLISSVPFHAGVVRTTVAPSDEKKSSGEQGTPDGAAGAVTRRSTVRPRQRRLVLPREYLAAHGVVEEDVYRQGAHAKGLRDAVFDTATRANDYIISARTVLRDTFNGKSVPPALVGPLVESVTASTLLDELQKRDFDIFDPHLLTVASGRGWRLPWNMWKVGMRGKL